MRGEQIYILFMPRPFFGSQSIIIVNMNPFLLGKDKRDPLYEGGNVLLDYDKALYYTLWGQWDELLVLMVRTNDDLLSKKIQYFLNSYHYGVNEKKIIESHDNLLYYIDHAMKQSPVETIRL